jgi:hypothetical protein
MEYNRKTNMIMVLTTVGVYVYLIKMEQTKETLEFVTIILFSLHLSH